MVVSRAYKTFSDTTQGTLPTPNHRALYLSQRTVGTGRLFAWMGGGGAHWRFSDEEFRCALQDRLLLTPRGNGERVQCACGMEVEPSDVHHEQRCSANAGRRTTRHSLLVRALTRALKGNAAAGVVTMSRDYPAPNGRMVVPDLEFSKPDGGVYRIDVKVVDPTSVKALESGSAAVAGAAAQRRERDTRTHYAGALPEGPGQHLVPFVLETPGRLGTEAARFVDTVFPPGSRSASTKHRLFSDIAIILARSSARLMMAVWGRGERVPDPIA
jgi:hypothetical protein